MLAGHNVHTIAVEVPMAMISNGSSVDRCLRLHEPAAVKIRTSRGIDRTRAGSHVQVQRLANPLVNELIIGPSTRIAGTRTKPNDEARFLGYYLKPRFALAEQLVFGVPTGCLIAAAGVHAGPAGQHGPRPGGFNRTDLQALLPAVQRRSSTGPGQGGATSDLLRLNLATPPTPLGQQSSVPGALGGDPAAWPNGRRPKDDVTDIAAKAVGGPNYLPLPTVDGVEDNDKAYPAAFPFLASPHDGVTRVHENR